MKVAGLLSDEAILAAIGQRLARLRIERNMTQAQLANEAGVAKRTVERVESGESIQFLTLVRLARVLGLIEDIAQLMPEQKPSPMALLKNKTRQKSPQRARSRKPAQHSGQPGEWKWGDDA